MKQIYLVTFKYDHSNMEDMQLINGTKGMSWRELQELFDPSYHFNSLKFFTIGSEIPFTG